MFQLILPEWRANLRFVETQCEVVAKGVGESDQQEGKLYRPEIKILYQLDGQPHSATTYDVNNFYSYSEQQAEEILADFEIGEHYACWYDPSASETVVLVRSYTWWMWLLLIIPGSFVVIGGVGAGIALLQSETSIERRSAMARRAADIDLFEDADVVENEYPQVPGIGNITDSPGTRLAFRLPADASTAWRLTGILLLCLLWNGIVGWFVIVNLSHHLTDRGDWWATLMLLPFLIAGILIAVFVAKQAFRLTGLGTTRLEVSEHPLYPGGTYPLFLSQSGHLKVDQLDLSLVCEETATYRQGTDTRIETVQVYNESVYQRGNFEVVPGRPFEEEFEIQIPESAMHSFQVPHNEVRWLLLVTAALEHRSDYERRFPIVVYPGTSLKP